MIGAGIAIGVGIASKQKNNKKADDSSSDDTH